MQTVRVRERVNSFLQVEDEGALCVIRSPSEAAAQSRAYDHYL